MMRIAAVLTLILAGCAAQPARAPNPQILSPAITETPPAPAKPDTVTQRAIDRATKGLADFDKRKRRPVE